MSDYLFTRHHQVVVPTSEDIRGRLAERIGAFAEMETFMGQRIRKHAFMGAVMHWIGNLSDDELRDFMTPKLRDFEAYAREYMNE